MMLVCLIGFTADLDGYDTGYADGFLRRPMAMVHSIMLKSISMKMGMGTGHDVNQDGQIDFTDGVDDKFV